MSFCGWNSDIHPRHVGVGVGLSFFGVGPLFFSGKEKPKGQPQILDSSREDIICTYANVQPCLLRFLIFLPAPSHRVTCGLDTLRFDQLEVSYDNSDPY